MFLYKFKFMNVIIKFYKNGEKWVMKRIFVFLLVAIAAISLSAVSAAEDASADVNTLTFSDDGAIISDVTNSDNATVETNLNTASVDVKNTAGNENDSVFEENKVISSYEDENTVTNSTFFNFFDNTGVLRDNITSSDLIFKGNFTGLNVNTITIGKSINILGQEAILEDMGIVITANDVSVSDLAFNLMNNSVIKSAIEVTSDNVTIFNNFIAMESAVNENSFAINAKGANNLTINNNSILYLGRTNGTVINSIIYLIDSDDVSVLNNTILAKLPSVPVAYTGPNATVMSVGIYADGSSDLNIESNNVTIECGNSYRYYDTIYALYVDNTNNAVIENNRVNTKGHTYVYGLHIGGKNINITSNDFNITSDNNYANGIEIADGSSGIIGNNKIVVESPMLTYGIYSSSWGNHANNFTYIANEVVANSSIIYAMYLSGNNENLINNVIKGNGNFTIGVASDAANLTLNGNNILINGTNIGSSAIYETISPETGGVKIVRGNATISENMILVNGAEFEDSFAIHAENADNLIIDENAIGFEGKTNGTGINNAIRVINSDNVNIENNNMYISIPSVSVQYDSVTREASVVSEGIRVDGFTTLNINSNSIAVEYNNASGFYNTVYALDINGDNAVIENNNITTKGHRYVYGINIAGENITISSNIITSISDDTYANAIQIQKGSMGIVNDNMIVVESPVVAYGIYSSDYLNRTNNITYVGNDVTGNSSYIYGIYVSGHNESLIDNFVGLTGNFTTDIASSADILTVNNNTCNAFGNNIGDSSQCGDSIVAETTGIKIVRGNATVINSTIVSDGDYAVNTTGAGSVTYNYLVANVGLGDNAVSANNKTIVENNMPNTFIKVPDVEKVYGTADKLVATLIDANTNPIANATITFNINGQKYNRTTNASGIASMAINLYPGIYEVVSTYNNNSYKSFIKVTSSIVGNDIVKIFQNGTQFYATFYDKDGKTLANNTNVSFNINGVFYTRQTNENGTAKLTINLRPGNYTLTAINPTNDEQRGFNVVVLPNIETKDLVKYYKNESQFVVKVLNKNGTPANGTNITFNINGVIYTRAVTDGYAKLTINLAPGKYTITTSYEGYEVGNSVIVNPTLITKDLSMNYKDGSTFNATVLDGQGKPLANQVVIFNVNGVFYNRTSGDDGIASLNINLNKGEYIITSMWNNYQVGNKITIA